MGDSAGGGFALALAQALLEKELPQPGNIILISPWLDITMTNPEIPAFEEKDPMLAVYGLAEIGKVYAGNTDPGHYMLSPINGPVVGLAPITLFMAPITCSAPMLAFSGTWPHLLASLNSRSPH
jgi:acetyl esterase/lipase